MALSIDKTLVDTTALDLVDLGVIAMKGHSTHPRTLEPKPYH